jgi:hypothetical protein
MSYDENTCDSCCGEPLPKGLTCMCGGTGKMSDAARYLRVELHRVTVERDALKKALDTFQFNAAQRRTEPRP